MIIKEPSGIRVTELDQVGIVVRDVDAVVRNYWDILGIGPWEIQILVRPGLFDTRLHGNPADFGFKCALCTLGSFQLELLQTIEGNTAYSDFMTCHGEAAHHLRYITDSPEEIEKHASIYAKYSIPSLMSGKFKDNGVFHYFDSSHALKTIIEAVKFADVFECAVTRYPENEAEHSPAEVKVKGITGVSIAVRNIEDVVANYRNLLGVGPWKAHVVGPEDIHNQIYRGKPSRYTMKTAMCQVGGVEIELIEPTSGDTIYGDFIIEHGEGIANLKFVADNIEQNKQAMREQGFYVAQGHEDVNMVRCCYDTTGPLKIMWEALELADR